MLLVDNSDLVVMEQKNYIHFNRNLNHRKQSAGANFKFLSGYE